jgi:RNA polymerase-binding protein DksA
MSVKPETDLASVRAVLLGERDELMETLSQVRSDAEGERPDSPDGIGETEHLAHAEQVDLSERVATLTEESLRNVTDALARIDSGSYGICTSCGGPVGEARLDALPSAELCIECQGRRG